MTQTPVVSVFMTVYNGERYLTEAIASIQQQTLQDFELIIVNDGSTDRTQEILFVAQTDPRIKVVSTPRLGRARALNIAWRETRGKYVANLDADDRSEPMRLEKQVAFLERHPEVGMLSTDSILYYEDTGEQKEARLPCTSAELRHELVRYCRIVHSSVMMSRHALQDVGGYNEAFRVAIDHELWVRIARRFELANLPHILTVRRMHRQRYFRNEITTWDRILAVMKVRSRAWWSFSREIPELRFVVIDPIVKFSYRGLRFGR
ncbi:MAG: hypothetical protein DCC55_08335 [Chloroflexi bacterium]|nr:MAG: hypothetical protein DCC55_08335 [Chloroflexota bacterium]